MYFEWLEPWFGDGVMFPPRVVVLDKVTDLLLFFGKLLVVGGVGKDATDIEATR